MLKRKPLMFFTVVLAVVTLLYTATQAVAEEEDLCYGYDPCTCFQDGPYTVKLLDGPVIANCPGTSGPGAPQCTTFTYDVDCKRIKDVLMLLPADCSPERILH